MPFIPFAASLFLAIFGLVAALTVAAPLWAYVPVLLLPAVGAAIGIIICAASRTAVAADSRRKTILSLAGAAMAFIVLAGAVCVALAAA